MVPVEPAGPQPPARWPRRLSTGRLHHHTRLRSKRQRGVAVWEAARACSRVPRRRAARGAMSHPEALSTASPTSSTQSPHCLARRRQTSSFRLPLWRHRLKQLRSPQPLGRPPPLPSLRLRPKAPANIHGKRRAHSVHALPRLYSPCPCASTALLALALLLHGSTHRVHAPPRLYSPWPCPTTALLTVSMLYHGSTRLGRAVGCHGSTCHRPTG